MPSPWLRFPKKEASRVFLMEVSLASQLWLVASSLLPCCQRHARTTRQPMCWSEWRKYLSKLAHTRDGPALFDQPVSNGANKGGHDDHRDIWDEGEEGRGVDRQA